MNRGTSDSGSYGQTYADQLQTDGTGVNQRDQQQDNSKMEKQSSGAASALAGQLMGISIGLIASGVAMNASSPCGCAGIPLIAMGAFFGLGSQGAQGAADNMQDRANTSDLFKADLNPINGIDQGIGVKTLNDKGVTGYTGASTNELKNSTGADSLKANTQSNLITIDSQALRSGKVGAAFDDLEKKYGINRDEFANAIASGQNLGDLLSKYGALGNKSADEFNKELANSKVDQGALRDQFQNGDFNDYKGIAKQDPNAEEALAEFSKGGKGMENAAADEKAKSVGAQPAKTYDQMMAEIFGKNSGETSLMDLLAKGDKSLSDPNDAELRKIASNDGYYLSSDFVKNNVYQELSIFDRIRQRYKARTPNLLPVDFFIRMQAEAEARKRN